MAPSPRTPGSSTAPGSRRCRRAHRLDAGNPRWRVDSSGNLIIVGGGTLGSSKNEPISDVWRYDGSWTYEPPLYIPPARASSLARDTRRNQLVVFGGVGFGKYLSDTWSYDGSVWNLRDLGNPPGARNSNGLVYDEARDRFVMFGGQSGMVSGMNDTYELDVASSGTWIPRTDVGTPPAARIARGMAYDGHITILFGGADGSTAFDDTWEYDGSAWQQIDTPIHPPGGDGRGPLVFDPANQRSIFVASDGTTWSYAAREWTMLDAPVVPRGTATLVFDPSAGRILRFGGWAKGTGLENDLWELDEAGWHELPVAGEVPPARIEGGMAAFGHGLVLFGGFSANNVLDDMWFLERRSATPDEVCDNGIDDDGDRHADAADPDCN